MSETRDSPGSAASRAATVSRRFGRTGWTSRHLVLGLCLVGLAIAVTHRAWGALGQLALAEAEAVYLLAVPVVAGWLVWVRRQRLRLCRPTGSLVGPGLVLVGWYLYAWVDGGARVPAWHTGALLILVGSILSITGLRLVAQFQPAFAVLVLLVPLPLTVREPVSAVLQHLLLELTRTLDWTLNPGGATAGLTEAAAHVTIAKACGSPGLLLSLLLVCYAFAFGKPLHGLVRGLVVAVTPVAAVGCGVLAMVVLPWLIGRLPEPGVLIELGQAATLIAAALILLGLLRLLGWASVPVGPYTLADKE